MQATLRRTISAIALMFALAEPAHAGALEDAYCVLTASFTEQVAKAHQTGVPLATVLNLNDPGLAGHAVRRAIIIAVYDSPRWHSAERKAEAVAKWRDQVHVECLKQVAKLHPIPAAGAKHRI